MGSPDPASPRLGPRTQAEQIAGSDWEQAVEECELLAADGANFDPDTFLSCASTPVLFTSAVLKPVRHPHPSHPGDEANPTQPPSVT